MYIHTILQCTNTVWVHTGKPRKFFICSLRLCKYHMTSFNSEKSWNATLNNTGCQRFWWEARMCDRPPPVSCFPSLLMSSNLNILFFFLTNKVETETEIVHIAGQAHDEMWNVQKQAWMPSAMTSAGQLKSFLDSVFYLTYFLGLTCAQSILVTPYNRKKWAFTSSEELERQEKIPEDILLTF